MCPVDGNVKGIEVIGYNQENKAYSMQSFDSLGNAGVMQARLENDTWNFVDQSMRFTGNFRDGGKVFAGIWELRTDDESIWQPWMKIRLRKVQ